MQSSQETNSINIQSSEPKAFAPFITKTLKVKGDEGFYFDTCSYNEKHNLIIACPTDNPLQFFDATTLSPSEQFKTEKLAHGVMAMSFCAETETFLLGCEDGNIYTYCLSNKTLKKLGQPVDQHVAGIAWMNCSDYAFSAFLSYQLHVGNLENKDFFHSTKWKSDICDVKSLPERNLLFSSFCYGSVVVYRTDRLPRLSILGSTPKRGGPKKLKSIKINRKYYILMAGEKFTIEIWHFTKGKMRRIKVIRMLEVKVENMVYLGNEKMIVTTHLTREIRFWRLYSGKLEETLDMEMDECSHTFLMKDKNTLGVVAYGQNSMKIVQLHPSEE